MRFHEKLSDFMKQNFSFDNILAINTYIYSISYFEIINIHK